MPTPAFRRVLSLLACLAGCPADLEPSPAACAGRAESTCDADQDGAFGEGSGGTDCDDGDPAIHPGAVEVCNARDDDCDGRVDDADPDRDVASAAPWFADLDQDGFGGGEAIVRCEAPAGRIADANDCDDLDPAVFPGATEVCGGVDDDCDGVVDDADPSVDLEGAASYAADVDGDGYGDPATVTLACEAPPDHVADATDCAPEDPSAHAIQSWWPDQDGDGSGDGTTAPIEACTGVVGHVADGLDCDDDDPELHPDVSWARDLDADGYGDPNFTLSQCLPPAGYVRDDTDCDDADPDVHPGAVWYEDVDGDGFGDLEHLVAGCDFSVPSSPDPTDCDDADVNVFPGAPELCDAVDNDCDGPADEDEDVVTWYPDADQDGFGDDALALDDCAPPAGWLQRAGDCDDTDPSLEAADVDGDGMSTCDGDCDDLDPAIWPGAPEPCDLDLDCDPVFHADFGEREPIVEDPLALGDPENLVAADLDADGDPDLVVAGLHGEMVAWIENRGDGDFAPEVPIALVAGGYDVEAADLDGDLDLDVLFGDTDTDTVAWAENLGGAVFAAPVPIATLGDPRGLAVADIDGDGQLDVLVAATIDGTLVWCQNLGGGAFSTPIVIDDSMYFDPWDADAADVDGDGDLDPIWVTDPAIGSGLPVGTLSWSENVGGGFVGVARIIDWLAWGSHGVTPADVDLDGHVDLVVPVTGDHALLWYRNLGQVDVAFEAARIIGVHLLGIAHARVADLDDDGDADVVATLPHVDRVVWWENVGAEAFAGPIDIDTAADGAEGLVIEDLDGDELVDLAVATGVDNAVRWYPGSCE